MRLAVIVDEGNHGLNRRSSSAWAKYAPRLAQDSVGLAEARGSRVPEPSALSPHPWEHRRAHHCRARLSSPTHAASAPCSRSWRRSTRASPPSARRSVFAFVIQNHSHRAGADLRKRTCWSSCLSWLHLLRSWSLRSTRERFRGLATMALIVALDDCIRWIVSLVGLEDLNAFRLAQLLKLMRTWPHLMTCGASRRDGKRWLPSSARELPRTTQADQILKA